MRESRPCGSERGAPSNGRPYREKRASSTTPSPTGSTKVRIGQSGSTSAIVTGTLTFYAATSTAIFPRSTT